MKYDYETIKFDLYHRNLTELQNDATKKPVPDYLKIKINNFCDNFGFEFSDVLTKIQNDPVVTANFIKDPGRQNFYENQCLEWLKNFNSIKLVKKLPASGKSAKYIINGKFIENTVMNERERVISQLTLKSNFKTVSKFMSHINTLRMKVELRIINITI